MIKPWDAVYIAVIVALLAFCGPLIISVGYRAHRVFGALAAAAWLLLALFFVGLNLGVGWELAVAYPVRAAAALSILTLAFFFLGPRSAVWAWAAGLSVFRVPADRFRAYLSQYDVSWRAGRELVATAAALVLLTPVAYFTVQPDPGYAHAKEKFERETAKLTITPEQMASEAITAAIRNFNIDKTVVDDEAGEAARREIVDDVTSLLNQLGKMKSAKPDVIERIKRVGENAEQDVRNNMESASDRAVRETSEGLLKLGHNAVANAIRRSMDEAREVEKERARRSIEKSSVADLQSLTYRLISQSDAAVRQAGHDTATLEIAGLLERSRRERASAGYTAAGQAARALVEWRKEAMKRVLDAAKNAQAVYDRNEAERAVERDRAPAVLIPSNRPVGVPPSSVTTPGRPGFDFFLGIRGLRIGPRPPGSSRMQFRGHRSSTPVRRR